MTKQRARTIGVVAGVWIGVLVVVGVVLSTMAPVSGMFLDPEESDGIFAEFTAAEQIPWWSETYDFGSPNGGCAIGDPILVVTGQLRHQETDLEVPSKGIPFRLVRVYRSGLGYNGPFGQNWDFNYNTRITVNSTATSATLYDGTGREDVFNVNGGTGILHPAEASRFEKILDVTTTAVSTVSTITRKTANPLLTWRYSNYGTGDLKWFRLVEIENNFQHKMLFAYGATPSDPDYRKLNKITDTESGVYDLLYNERGYIWKVVDIADREICYSYDESGRLTKVQEPPPATGSLYTTEYKYDSTSNRITEVYSPEQPASTGTPYIKTTYNGTTGKVTKQQAVATAGTGGLGEYSLEYGTSGDTVTVFNRSNKKSVYRFDTASRVTTIEVYEGTTKHETERTYHTNGQIHQIKHPKDGSGNRRVETFTYSTDSDPIKRARLLEHKVEPATSAKGEGTLTWEYGAYDDLWNIPTYVVDANGLETSLTISGSTAYTFTTKVGPSGNPQSISVAEYDAAGRLSLAKRLVTGSTYEETVFYYGNSYTGLVSSIAVKGGIV